MQTMALVIGGAAAIGLLSLARRKLQRGVTLTPRLRAQYVMGDEGRRLSADDLRALTPLFGQSAQSTTVAPACDVLFIYARIQASGIVEGSKVGLRDIIHNSGAKIVVVAAENSGDAYIAGAPRMAHGG